MTIRGLALSGFLLALAGALLPGWDYHLTERYASAGWLFFALGTGRLAAGFFQASSPLPRLGGYALAVFTLVALGLFPSPVPYSAQFTAWLALGLASGLIDRKPTASITHVGIYFVSGCLASVVAVAAAMRWGYGAHLLLALALVPLLFGFLSRKPTEPAPSPREALRKFSLPGALTLAALLLLQSGSEWTLAGWLPLFLTHRLGISPETALWMLALYWLALLLGRIANRFLLARARHGRILFSSAAASLLGCLLLVSTDNALGATVAILLLGTGLAAIYPLLAQKMGSRFPQDQAGVPGGIFSLALSGGLLFPWFAGLLAQSFSLTAILAIPALCVLLVFALLLVLWLESKVTGR